MRNQLNILLAGLMVASSVFAAETENVRLVARHDFETSSLWRPKVFMKRDFWVILPGSRFNPKRKDPGNGLYFPTASLPEPMKKYLDIPAFTQVAIKAAPLARENLRKNSNGTVTLVPLTDYSEWVPAECPFIVSTIRFTRLMPHAFDLWLHDNYEPYAEYEVWKTRHPNFWYAHGLSEWGNNMSILFYRLPGYVSDGKITLAEMAGLKEKYMENPPDRRAYVNHLLKPDFDQACKVWQGDTAVQDALDGMWNIGHLAAYWGAGMLTMEASRSLFSNWHFQLMSYRGAARQFDIPWCWYTANHISIRDADGVATGRGVDPWAWTSERGSPDTGASLSSRERVYYMAYLAGANAFQSETATMCYWDATATGEERWKPAAEGQIYIDFFNFTQRNPQRGSPYTPIALLVAYDRGTSRQNGKAFWRYRYRHSDNMLDAFISTLFPPVSARVMHRQGIERTLRNSKYGDVFDVITPDFEKTAAFARILPTYKAAILIGDYEDHPDMVKAMVTYVQDGGTLILNAKHLNLKFPDGFLGVGEDGEFAEEGYQFTLLKPDRASVLLADAQNRPIFTRNVYGKGAVVVGAPHFLTPYYDDSSEKAADKALTATASGLQKFPHIAWLLDHLLEETLPAKVTGDIQYGFNRTPDGWWLYLFNNKGVLKTAITPQKLDPAAKTVVHVDLSQLQPTAVHDLVTGESLAGTALDISVDPGRYRILEIRVPQ